MDLAILPLAVTMMAGPQILSSIIFVTTKNASRISLSYLSGILLGLVAGTILSFWVFNTFLSDTNIGNTDETSGLKPIQFLLVGLLIYLTVTTYLGREKAEQPTWLKGLSAMKPAKAVALGFLLITLFPSDFLILLTVGATLVQDGQNLLAAIPFIALTFLIAASPFLLYMLFRSKMEAVMPKVRDWMENNSWIISIAVYILFIFLII